MMENTWQSDQLILCRQPHFPAQEKTNRISSLWPLISFYWHVVQSQLSSVKCWEITEGSDILQNSRFHRSRLSTLPLGEVWNINTGLYTAFYLNRETYQMYNVIQNILTKINI